MKKLLALVIVLGLVFVSNISRAAEVKIGYMDFEKAFNEYEKTKTEDAKLKAELDKKEKELEKKTTEISKMRDELELLNDEAKAKKEEEIRKKIQELNEVKKNARQELMEARNKKWLEIYDEIKVIVAKYGKDKGYTYIFDDKAIIYKTEGFDVTQDIVNILNKK